MQKMHAESLIASKLNMHYGPPPLLDTTMAPNNKNILTSPHLFIQEQTTSILTHTKKYSIMSKITYLFKFFIQFKLIQNKIIFYYGNHIVKLMSFTHLELVLKIKTFDEKKLKTVTVIKKNSFLVSVSICKGYFVPTICGHL